MKEYTIGGAKEADEIQRIYLERKKSTDKVLYFTHREAYDWLESILLSIICVVAVLTFIVRVNQVYGISMQPTLHSGDRLIVSPLLYSLDYGDIVVIQAENLLNYDTGEMGEPIVKRIIGLPGDVIFIDRVSGEVYRNGERLDEPYIAEMIRPERVGNQSYPLTIPENQIFVMGDNRNFSTDSRFTEGDSPYYVGCVELEYVMGKAMFRIWPFGDFGGLYAE